ncbi:porin [Sedimentimonas flavescens]|uniref:Porin n=1 Tax=Sedimentimonas flavescens TaxID=2851012 RepID=A0ABT2ZZJ4_9RHOB|nr:porin [Sedimentimonas flavescens]MCV2879181.1 porin [Sedimentimonas flavescens]
MKKVLLASTALVFSAGFAAAEVTIDGSANMGFKYNEAGLGYAGKDTAGWYEIDMTVTGTMESDAGLTFGATVDLDSVYGNDNQDYGGTVFASGAFGTFTVGMVDPVADDYGLSDIGFDGIGVDDIAELGNYSLGKSSLKGLLGAANNEDLADMLGVSEDVLDAWGTTADARWDYSVGAITLGASIDTINEDYSIAGAYDFGMVKAALAYSKDDATDTDSTQFKLSGSQNGFGGELFYATSDLADSWGLYGSYKTGALTLEASYSNADFDNGVPEIGGESIDAWGIGAKYDLGGGAKVAGGVGDIDGNTVADLGVTFSF